MKNPVPFVAFFACAAAAGAAFSVFGAPPPPTTSATAYASGAPSALASASAAPEIDPKFKPYEPQPGPPAAPKKSAWVPPSEKSDKPAEKDWEHAEPLELPRNHALCKAQKIREWVRVECHRDPIDFEPFVGVRVVGGSHTDVTVSNSPKLPKETQPLGVVFPVRKGDRRMLEFAGAIAPEWKSWTVTEELVFTVSEEWLESEAAPIIAVD